MYSKYKYDIQYLSKPKDEGKFCWEAGSYKRIIAAIYIYSYSYMNAIIINALQHRY